MENRRFPFFIFEGACRSTATRLKYMRGRALRVRQPRFLAIPMGNTRKRMALPFHVWMATSSHCGSRKRTQDQEQILYQCIVILF